MNLALNCWFFKCYCKNATILHVVYYSTYGLEENNNKIYCIYGKVVYQRVRREMRLASDNSWTPHRLKHLRWRSRWEELSCAHLNGEWQFHAKYHELIGAFLACPPDWPRGPPLLCAECGLPLPGCWTIVPVMRILFSRLSIISFRPLSGNSLNSLHAPYCFDR